MPARLGFVVVVRLGLALVKCVNGAASDTGMRRSNSLSFVESFSFFFFLLLLLLLLLLVVLPLGILEEVFSS